MMRKHKYIICALIAFIACLAYNTYGDSKHRKKAKTENISTVHGFTRDVSTSESDAANKSTDFSLTGTVAPIDGVSEQILKRTSYIVSYNKDTRCPNWVAWRLTADHTTGDVGRMGNAFHEDMDVPEPRAINTDFKESGFSRGHLCPAGDNKWDRDAMYETFLLSNVCPQNANLNSGVWNQIEMSCRQWAERYGDLYIITGPMYFKSQELRYIGENQIAVPDAFFKVILCLNEPKAIGFICRNTDGNKRKDQYINSLSQVERLTGLHFFPTLDSETRKLVEDHADINEW